MQARDKHVGGPGDDPDDSDENDENDEQLDAAGDEASLVPVPAQLDVEQGELLGPDRDGAPDAAGEVDLVEQLRQPARRRARKSAKPGSSGARDTDLTPLRSPIQRFMAETRRYPRLTDEEEKRLIKEVRETGDASAARTLVLHNLRLVVSIAYQYRQAWTNVLDLFQEGSVGLLEAVKRWDPTLGTRFGSYAAYWIRAYILKFLMTNARLIHVGNTRAGRKLFFRLERERQKLLAGGFDATPKLLAAKLDVDVKDVEEVSAHLASREVSLDPRPDDEGLPLEERLAGAAVSPEAQAARSELSGAIAGLMSKFAAELTDEREKAIWHDHLAAPEEPVPLGTLGARFGVSKQRMGQIADRLKKRFRDRILAELGTEIQLEWQQQAD